MYCTWKSDPFWGASPLHCITSISVYTYTDLYIIYSIYKIWLAVTADDIHFFNFAPLQAHCGMIESAHNSYDYILIESFNVDNSLEPIYLFYYEEHVYGTGHYYQSIREGINVLNAI